LGSQSVYRVGEPGGDALLLEYFLGEEKSYLWAVTRTEITAHVLPPPAEQYEAQALALSRMVLGPVADRLSTSRLLIVPDGALQYVPFQALTSPAAEQADEVSPLVVTHEIVNEPSAASRPSRC
jgi:hypothetical protein